MAKAIYLTVEPNEENSDAFSTTAYFLTEEDDEAVSEAIQRILADQGLPGWEDCSGFSVRATKLQPFQEYTRWQIDPVLEGE